MSEPTPKGLPPDNWERPDTLERRATWLLVLLVLLVACSAAYLLYARGVFEPTQRLVLLADDSEGVTVGMDMTFSGFPVGRVSRIELSQQGTARILIDIPKRDARWLRQSSVFTLTRGLVGNTSLRAFTGVVTDQPLPDGAERRVLIGDATSEIPQLVAQVRGLVTNLSALTASDSALAGTLTQAQGLTARLNEPGGALGVLMGNPADAQKLMKVVEQTRLTLQRIESLTVRTDSLVSRADSVLADAGNQVFGPQGLARDVQASVKQAQALLVDARASLQRVDALLQDAQATARNVRGASSDLDVLRSEVEASLRQVDGLVADINRKWPFKRDSELKLP